jgi:hypothetical protein
MEEEGAAETVETVDVAVEVELEVVDGAELVASAEIVVDGHGVSPQC